MRNYDGDRNSDLGLFHDGYWYIQSNPLGFQSVIQFGGPGDIPVPQDYDGDGKAEIAVFRPWTSEWWMTRSSDNTAARSVRRSGRYSGAVELIY